MARGGSACFDALLQQEVWQQLASALAVQAALSLLFSAALGLAASAACNEQAQARVETVRLRISFFMLLMMELPFLFGFGKLDDRQTRFVQSLNLPFRETSRPARS